MPRQPAHWRKIVFLYILQLFSYATSTVRVELIAPRYVKYGSTATLACNHSVPEKDLHKIEFVKDNNKILQYIKGRKPPFLKSQFDGGNMEYSENGTTIKLKGVNFDASGSYSCLVSMASPIYAQPSDSVQMKVIVPQSDNPNITFTEMRYTVGENLEANCSSSAARPVPHLTWFINGKEVDATLVNHYPHTHHKDHLMSATAKLTMEVSELHAGENGRLEISCHSTIPDYPMHHDQYADIRKHTVSVRIIRTPVALSSAMSVAQELALSSILCALCILRAVHKIIP